MSHTSDMAAIPEDRPFARAAMDAVNRASMAPVDMSYFAARDGSPADYCRERVQACEIYIAVVGFRYGSLVPGEQISYTELEFLAASEAGIPRLVFLLAEDTYPSGHADTDRTAVEGFRQRLRAAGLIVREFATADRLELEVLHALSVLGQVGPREPPGPGNAPGGAAFPRICNTPRRNADFTGREAILDKLHEELAGDGAAVVLAQALYGLGGVGKTQLALEYAHRFQSDYDLIWWIPAEHTQEISLALADLASDLGVQTSDNAAEAAALALERLRHHAVGRWLLIFDNAENPEDLEPYLPTGSGHVLITSRNHGWTSYARPVELDVFTREESIEHLRRHVPGLNPADAAKVSSAVGDLPLAIEQAGAWLAETGTPVRMYVEWLAKEASSALGMNKPPDYAAPVAATWNLSLSRLQRQSPAAVGLLQIIAFCSPGPISTTLLYSEGMADCLIPFDKTLRDIRLLGPVIRSIGSLALVRIHPSGDSLQIHRLVQAVIRFRMTEDERRTANHAVHKILASARPRQGDIDDPANWSTYDLIWSHLGPSRAEECDDPTTRQLLLDWVRYQWKLGEYEAGLALAERLRELWTRQLGPDDEQTLFLQSQAANILRTQGRLHEARDLDSYVMERQRAVLGPDHLHTLITANGLAADLRALGDFEQSLALDKATYEGLKAHFGEEYPRTLIAAHNVGCSLRLMGDYLQASRLDKQNLTRERRVLGTAHPFTLMSTVSLAHDLRATGAFRESVRLLRDTWEQYQEILGDDIADTLACATSLAVSLRKAGELAEAKALSEQTYERYERRYGRDAPDAQRCALDLAGDYAASGDLPRAVELAAEVRAAYQSTLGDDHPNTLVAANNLACYLRRTGHLPEALAIAGDTLTRMQRGLGGNHPLTLACAVNLASCRSDSGDLESADALARSTLPLLKESLGPEHPDTLACEANHAVTLCRAGRAEEAEQARALTLDRLAQSLGPEHPYLALLQSWQHIDCDLEPPQI